MPHDHHDTHWTTDAPSFEGRTFCTPLRDAVAYLLSGIVCAVLVAYVAMLVAWFAAGSQAA